MGQCIHLAEAILKNSSDAIRSIISDEFERHYNIQSPTFRNSGFEPPKIFLLEQV